MGADNSYPLRSLKWHFARFFENPDEDQLNTNATVLIGSCMVLSAMAGFTLMDEGPSSTAPTGTSASIVERYEASLDHLDNLHEQLITANNLDKLNALPGVDDIAAPANTVTLEEFNTQATTFISSALTDQSMSEQDISNLLTTFSEEITPISELGFSGSTDMTFLNEAQAKYRADNDVASLNNDAAKDVSEIMSEMNGMNNLGQFFFGGLVGGLGGGLGLAFLLIQLICGGARGEALKKIARSPKPTRQRPVSH